MSHGHKITRKLRAILSADVKGYSLLMSDDEVLTLKTLDEYKGIMSELITSHSGRVVDSPGDNMLAEFSSAVDAVECAIKIQSRLKKENSKYADHRKLEFRIGINIGDVLHQEERIIGEGVNIASRLEGLADAGGICISRNTYDHIKNKLDIQTKYLGEHEVKNIKEPVRVYKILLESESYQPLVKEKLDLPDKPSIAVLPFTNMSGDPSQEYFSDGLTEHIITWLSKIPNLFVIARNSSFAYKGKAISIKQIAKELGVKYILEGSVQKAGNRVRITAQFIDATTDYHMWSETYDGELDDIFKLQDDIVNLILNAVGVCLTTGEQIHSMLKDIRNFQALDQLLKGWNCFNRMNKQDVAQSRIYFKNAFGIDESSATPCAMIGLTHLIDLQFNWSDSPLESFAKAEEWATKAIDKNASLDGPYSLMGIIHLYKKEFDEAVKLAEHSIKLNPNGAEAHSALGMVLFFAGKPEKGLIYSKKAIRLNPMPPAMYYNILGFNYRGMEKHTEAIECFNQSLAIEPDGILAYLLSVSSYVFLNRLDKAKHCAEKVLELNPNFSLEYYKNTTPFKDQNYLDSVVDSLRKAGLPD